MNTISQIETIVPEFCYQTEEIYKLLNSNLLSTEQQELQKRFFQKSAIQQRFFCLPLEKIKSLKSNEERSALYRELGVNLVTSLLKKLSEKIDLSKITHLISTSCTIPTIPALDTGFIHSSGLSANIKRIPIYQHGCIASAIGLSIANDLVSEKGDCLLLSVELCSLLFANDESDPETILGNSLFADAAACAVISANGGKFKIVSTKSYLLPDSAQFLGYEIKDHFTKVLLKKDIITTIEKNIHFAVTSFLEENNLTPADIDWWLIHPGGYRIIKTIEENLNIPKKKSRYTWEILNSYGNVSSAALLFILKKLESEREYKKGQKILMLGMGPGMTTELILFEVG